MSEPLVRTKGGWLVHGRFVTLGEMHRLCAEHGACESCYAPRGELCVARRKRGDYGQRYPAGTPHLSRLLSWGQGGYPVRAEGAGDGG